MPNSQRNTGYVIDNIYSREHFTGEKVEFATDVMSVTVTIYLYQLTALALGARSQARWY